MKLIIFGLLAIVCLVEVSSIPCHGASKNKQDSAMDAMEMEAVKMMNAMEGSARKKRQDPFSGMAHQGMDAMQGGAQQGMEAAKSFPGFQQGMDMMKSFGRKKREADEEAVIEETKDCAEPADELEDNVYKMDDKCQEE